MKLGIFTINVLHFAFGPFSETEKLKENPIMIVREKKGGKLMQRFFLNCSEIYIFVNSEQFQLK